MRKVVVFLQLLLSRKPWKILFCLTESFLQDSGTMNQLWRTADDVWWPMTKVKSHNPDMAYFSNLLVPCNLHHGHLKTRHPLSHLCPSQCHLHGINFYTLSTWKTHLRLCKRSTTIGRSGSSPGVLTNYSPHHQCRVYHLLLSVNCANTIFPDVLLIPL